MNISKRNKELGDRGSEIVDGTLLVGGILSLAAGVTMAILGITCVNPEQQFVMERVKNHLVIANTSNSVSVALQQLSEATTELDQYLKVYPLAKDSKDSEDFQDWYQQILRIKHRFTLARAVEDSPASPLEKLQAEDIVLKGFREFAEVKLTNAFGASLGIDYNVPRNIPIQLNGVQEVILSFPIVLISVGVISVLLAFGRAIVSD